VYYSKSEAMVKWDLDDVFPEFLGKSLLNGIGRLSAVIL
jgi:hypothetical protein